MNKLYLRHPGGAVEQLSWPKRSVVSELNYILRNTHPTLALIAASVALTICVLAVL